MCMSQTRNVCQAMFCGMVKRTNILHGKQKSKMFGQQRFLLLSKALDKALSGAPLVINLLYLSVLQRKSNIYHMLRLLIETLFRPLLPCVI